MGMTYTGEASCENCGMYIKHIILTGAKEQAANGNTWWECRRGQVCPGCGQQLHGLLEPTAKLPETAQGQ